MRGGGGRWLEKSERRTNPGLPNGPLFLCATALVRLLPIFGPWPARGTLAPKSAIPELGTWSALYMHRPVFRTYWLLAAVVR